MEENRFIEMAKPILFNTDMVRAILEGRKTVTRRVIKDKDIINAWDCESDGTPIAFIDQGTGDSHPPTFPCQYQLGDILYVRETWAKRASDRCNGVETGRCSFEACETAPGPCFSEEYIYKATDSLPTYGCKWHPSIHMPKEAARLFLRVTDVRVERLLTPFFSDGAAVLALRQEGMALPRECVECIGNYRTPACIDAGDDSECGILDEIRGDFSDLWNNTIKPADLPIYGWSANPWVWVISFEKMNEIKIRETL